MAQSNGAPAQLAAVQTAVKAAQAVTYHPDHMRHLSVEDQKRWTDVHAALSAIAAAAGVSVRAG